MVIEWRSLQTFVFSKNREAVTTITPITSQWVRIEVKPLVRVKGDWYRAGWLNQVSVIGGRDYLQRSQVVPFAPSIYQFEPGYPYKLRFKPVPYMPNAIVRIYRSYEP